MATLVLSADESFEDFFRYDEDIEMVIPVDKIDVIINRAGHCTEILKNQFIDTTEIYKY